MNARIGGEPAPAVIGDDAWLRGDFVATVQQRGEAIIRARGHSSAASAANAIIDSVRAIHEGTAPGDWSSLAVVSHGEYGVPEGVVCGFPVASTGLSWQVVEGIQHNEEAARRIATSADELGEERELVRHLMPTRP